jgi:UDP-3-O-[3-hydroxymyristoyl] glucosamine N-acyltransferase
MRRHWSVPSAQVDPSAAIGPYAVIGPDVVIGRHTTIGAHSIVEQGSSIGDETVIHPSVYIGHSVQIGNRCEIYPNTTIGKEGYGYAHDQKGNHYKIPHQGGVVLEDDVHIGANCAIDRGTFGETRIEFGTKIDNQCHIGHNCKIGRNGLLTAHLAMAGSSEVGDNFICGGKTAITGHIKITNNVQLAALSGVGKNIDQPGQYGGNPLLPLQEFIKTKVALTHLTEMRKQVNRLMQKVFPEGKE